MSRWRIKIKRNILIFALCILLDAAALGRQPPPSRSLTSGNIRDYFTVFFQNTSSAEITGYTFVVWFVDLEERTHFVPEPAPGDTAQIVKPGKNASVNYPAPEKLAFAFPIANAYVLHAEFADGSV